MSIVYVCISSREYLGQAHVLRDSLQGAPFVLYVYGDDATQELAKKHFTEVRDARKFPKMYDDTMQQILSIRPKVVLDAFSEFNENVVFCGADMYFERITMFSQYRYGDDSVFFPHITFPLPRDGKFPTTQGVMRTGSINSDLVVWGQDAVEFLQWQASFLESNCVDVSGNFYDQTSLQMAPSMILNSYIDRSHAHNVAYWNMQQRKFIVEHGYPWITRENEFIPSAISCFQFSGLDFDHPERLSRHQNRITLSGPELEWVKAYIAKVQEARKLYA